jgi:AAA+ superfamily predicted ATPase
MAFCCRCGSPCGDATAYCPLCVEVKQLCSEIVDFILQVGSRLQPALTMARINGNSVEMLIRDFSKVVVTFGVADGSLAPSELAILADFYSCGGMNNDKAVEIALATAKRFLTESGNLLPEMPLMLPVLDAYDQASRTRCGDVMCNLLFRLANLVARADGLVTDSEIAALREYDWILRYGVTESQSTGTGDVPAVAPHDSFQINQSSPFSSESHSWDQTSGNSRCGASKPSARSIESLLGELNGLIGLDEVKQEVNQLAAFLEVERLRKERGMKESGLSLHLVFYGNPGTGKTTVARLIAQIYQSLGFLSRGHLVETDRSKLVGGYLGQTALKTQEVIESALGGVLFIDEAYSLTRAEASQDSYGKEAIETILKSMEDRRKDLVVIAAGYPAEMADFIASNPGLKSRFNRFINFTDYDPRQLFQIFTGFASAAQYRVSSAASDKLHILFEEGFRHRDMQFGNGRFVRNLFEQCIANLASRIVTLPHITNEMLTTIELLDIPSSALSQQEESVQPRKIGFQVSSA